MRSALIFATLGCVALVTASCATAPTKTPLMLSSQTLSVVMATAMLSPAEVVNVTSASVKANPSLAAVIAATAVASAPQQVAGIRAAAITQAPDQAEAIIKATRVALRNIPTRIDVRIRTADELVALIDRATR